MMMFKCGSVNVTSRSEEKLEHRRRRLRRRFVKEEKKEKREKKFISMIIFRSFVCLFVRLTLFSFDCTRGKEKEENVDDRKRDLKRKCVFQNEKFKGKCKFVCLFVRLSACLPEADEVFFLQTERKI